MGALGSRDLAPGAPGALLVSPTPVELVSGAEEGAVVLPGCSLDLHVLLAHGDRVEACQGFPHGLGPDAPDGPCVAIEGSLRATTSGGAWRPLPADAEPSLRRSAGAPR
jgi:hypothetical protein